MSGTLLSTLLNNISLVLTKIFLKGLPAVRKRHRLWNGKKAAVALERNFTQETQKWKYAVLVRVPENGHSHITGIIISCENLFREQFISIYQNLKHAHSAVNPHLEFSQWICFHMRKKMYVLEKSMAVMSIWKMSTKWVLIKLCYSCTNGILTICYKELV